VLNRTVGLRDSIAKEVGKTSPSTLRQDRGRRDFPFAGDDFVSTLTEPLKKA
jgi:hypothetical protein